MDLKELVKSKVQELNLQLWDMLEFAGMKEMMNLLVRKVPNDQVWKYLGVLIQMEWRSKHQVIDKHPTPETRTPEEKDTIDRIVAVLKNSLVGEK